jgi:hypothetical protein
MTGLVSFGVGMLMGSALNDNWCDWDGGAVVVPAYRGGYAGWGRPPAGYGGRNGYQSGNNVNVSGNTFNVNNSRRWSPDNSRRAAAGGTTSATRASTRPARTDFGYTAGGTARPAARQTGAGNAFGDYNRAATTRQDSARGAQSLSGARANGSVAPRAGTTRPAATRPTGAAPATAATRPRAAGAPQTGNLNRQRNPSGGAPAAFNVNRGGADRAASRRGRSSMGSAQRQGFRPSGGRGR